MRETCFPNQKCAGKHVSLMRLVTRRLPKAVKTNRETRFLVKVGDDFYRTRHCPTD